MLVVVIFAFIFGRSSQFSIIVIIVNMLLIIVPFTAGTINGRPADAARIHFLILGSSHFIPRFGEILFSHDDVPNEGGCTEWDGWAALRKRRILSFLPRVHEGTDEYIV